MSVDPTGAVLGESVMFVVEMRRKAAAGKQSAPPSTDGKPIGTAGTLLSPDDTAGGTKSFLWGQDDADRANDLLPGDDDTGAIPIPLNRVKANMEAACRQVSQMLEDVRSVGQFRLSEITLQVEISAEGGVQFIGTSKVAGKGAITLKFVEAVK